MTLSRQHALTLPASPRAVKLARGWVGKVLGEIGRDDLVESAELGVSELVTNAIMHSTPPVAVRVRGTKDHPRIEVADRSLVPPRPTAPEEVDEQLLTFGRGLSLLAMHSAAWGSDLDDDGHGKTVWFEPVAEPRDELVVDGELYDLDEVMDSRSPAPSDQDTVRVRLIGMPVQTFADSRRYYNELRRELRLLAVTNPDRYPLAVQFSELALQAEAERRMAKGLDVLARAEADGEERVDLTYDCPPTAPATMGAISELLTRVLSFFDDEALLATRPDERTLAVQDWYLNEFVRQGAGEDPREWTGGYARRRTRTAS